MYCLEIWVNNFNNNLTFISTIFNFTKNAIQIVNKNIFKIINNFLFFTNTNNLFVCSNILKLKDLITYKKYCIHTQCTFKEMPKHNILSFL